jgi:hypothetical protein
MHVRRPILLFIVLDFLCYASVKQCFENLLACIIYGFLWHVLTDELRQFNLALKAIVLIGSEETIIKVFCVGNAVNRLLRSASDCADCESLLVRLKAAAVVAL